jgi:two-component system CheB/CheR fusion protein
LLTSLPFPINMEIVQFHGKTGAYLEPPAGQPSFSVARMAREGLLVDLRAALDAAKKSNATVRKDRVHIQSEGGPREISLEVVPLRGPTAHECFYVVVFQDGVGKPEVGEDKGKAGKIVKVARAGAPEAELLKRETNQLREQLRSLIEEHETTAEEFKASHEEVLSANEELQSTNENWKPPRRSCNPRMRNLLRSTRKCRTATRSWARPTTIC